MSTQVVAASGVVVDLSAQLAGSDPAARAQAQTLLDMDAYARSKGYAAYNAVPTDEANAAWQAFYDKNQKAQGLPTIAEQSAVQALLTSGDAHYTEDGRLELGDAAAADRVLGLGGRNYGTPGSANAAAVNAAAQALLATAVVPGSAAAFAATVAASAPDLFPNGVPSATPALSGPPSTQFNDTSAAPAPLVQVDPAPPGAQTVSVTSAGPVGAPQAPEPKRGGAVWWLAALAVAWYLARRGA